MTATEESRSSKSAPICTPSSVAPSESHADSSEWQSQVVSAQAALAGNDGAP